MTRAEVLKLLRLENVSQRSQRHMRPSFTRRALASVTVMHCRGCVSAMLICCDGSLKPAAYEDGGQIHRTVT